VAIASALTLFAGFSSAVNASSSKAPVIASEEDRLSFYENSAPQPFFLEDAKPIEAAIDFVRFTGISKNLSLLLLHDVKNADVVQAAIGKYGFEDVKNGVVRAIKAEQNKHATTWDTMLARVYLSHFDAKALKSLQTKREASPHFLTMIELQDTISGEVQENGLAVIEAAKASILEAIAKQFPV